MIGDVLSDALAEIERYQTDPVFARRYEEPQLASRIEALKAAMRDLLRELDTPPRTGVAGTDPLAVRATMPSKATDPTTGKGMTVAGATLTPSFEIIGEHYVWDTEDACIDFYVLCYDGPRNVMAVIVAGSGPAFYFPVDASWEGEPHESLLRQAYAAWREVS